MTKYDDASWYYGGTYPADPSNDAAATHIAMFLTWCLLNGFADNEVSQVWSDELHELETRRITPGTFLMECMDGKFISDDLTATGNAFTIAYYMGEDDDSRYIDDFIETFGSNATNLYRVSGTWEVFDLIAERIAARYSSWIDAGQPRSIA